MKRSVSKALLVLLLVCGSISAQVTITNVYVSASTGTTATIVWTTSGPATSQVIYGLNTGSYFPYSSPLNRNLVTSHTITLTVLNTTTLYNFAAVSVDNAGHSTQSATFNFSLCGAPMVPISATANNYYQYGSYSLTWVPPTGSSGTPTVCGGAMQTTITGSLSGGASLSASVADASKVIPGPGQWQLTVTDAGNLAPVTLNSFITFANQDVSSQLQAAVAVAGLQGVIANTTNSTCFPAFACAGSGGGPNNFPGTAHQFITSYDSATKNFASAQPAFTDISGVATPAQLPVGTTSAVGGVKCDGTTITCTSGVIAAIASGNTTSTSLTTNVVPKANGPNSIINSALDDGATTANTLTYTGSAGEAFRNGRFAVGTPLSFTPQTIAGGGFQNDEYQETAIDSYTGLVWHHHQNLDSSLGSAVVNALANDLNTTDFTYCGGQEWYLSSAGYPVGSLAPNWDDRGNAFDRFNNCGNLNFESGLGDYQVFTTDLNYTSAGIQPSNLAEIIQPNGVTAFYKLAGFNTNIIATPAAPSGTPSTAGGTVTAGSNYAKLVGLDFATYPFLPPSQHSAAGTESSVVTTTGSTSSIAWNWTPDSNVLSYQFWVGSTSNGEANYFTVNPAAYETGYGTATVVSGATVPAGTYYFRVVGVDALGNKTLLGGSDTLGFVTVASPQNAIMWSCPATAQAVSYQIWVGTAAGSEVNFFTFTPPANNPNYCEYMQTLPISSGTSGTTPTYTFLQVAPISSGTGGSLPTYGNTGVINNTLITPSSGAPGIITVPSGATLTPITLTTTGASGAATFNPTTGALNIPNYAGGGSGCIPSATLNFFLIGGASSTCPNGHLDDGATTAGTITASERIAVTDGTGLGGGFNGTEGTAPTGASGVDDIWADSTAHRLKMNNNNGGAVTIAGIPDITMANLQAGTVGSGLGPFNFNNNTVSTSGLFEGTPQGTATSSANFNAAPLNFLSSVWNGTSAIPDTVSFGVAAGTGANPTITLSVGHSGSPGAFTVAVPQLDINTITGSTQCIQADTNGNLSGTGSACGSGGGAAFPGTNGVVFNTSTTASRNATSTDIIGLWTTCTAGFLKFDGTCANPSGSGTVTTSGSPSTGFLSLFTGSTVIGNSLFADTGTIGSYAGTGGFGPTHLFSADINTCEDTSGSGTAQVCNTISNFTPVGNPSSCIVYQTTTTNSGTGLTLNVNSFSAHSIAIPGASGWTTTLTAGIIPANKPSWVCYDGTNWDLASTGTTASGGFTNPMTTLGDVIYGGASGVATRLAGQTTAATYILSETATGSAVAPVWLNLASTGKPIGGTTLNLSGSITGVSANSFTTATSGLIAQQLLLANNGSAVSTGSSIGFAMEDGGFTSRIQGTFGDVQTVNTATTPSADFFWNTMLAGTLAERMRLTAAGNLTIAQAFDSSATQTTVNCTTGTVVFSEPMAGSSLKQVEIFANNCTGTASYTYPTAFTNTPQVLSQTLAAVATSVSTTAVTITGTTTTGFLKLDGY